MLSKPHVVMMAGGSGTRFWPLSRKRLPKQFLPLVSKRSMIQMTYQRVVSLTAPSRVLVVCGPAHRALVRSHLARISPANVIVEPEARNTAPAIALATAHVFAEQPDATIVVVPSDQHVADVAKFQQSVARAIEVARSGYIVTLGITPTRPDTGYGYIQQGPELPAGGYAVQRFVEKPNRELAQHYLDSGAYTWNAGIFVFRADVMRAAFAQHLPEAAKAIDDISKAVGSRRYPATLRRAFRKIPTISIDYAVAEKSANMAVVPGDFGWCDVGSFESLDGVRTLDAAGNIVESSQSVLIDASGCVVLGKGKPIAVVGVRDLVVVDTPDALLVMPKKDSQRVREVVDALAKKKLNRVL